MNLVSIFVGLGCLKSLAASGVAQKDDSASVLIRSLNDDALTAIRTKTPADKRGARRDGTCNESNVVRRRNWIDMAGDERKNYTNAVKCLMALPAKSDPYWAPGAKSRYDDFVAIHQNLTLEVHGTGNFLVWHRYYLWAYETALREECGYTGYQPYWDWFSYQDDMTKSPVFDGSDTSMSGDGEFVQHNGSLGGANNIYMPSANGGGCVTSGPFKDTILNLGPISPGMDGQKNVTGLSYNPRCISRDLNPWILHKWLTKENLYNIILGDASVDIGAFQSELQGRFADGFLGMHAAAHFSIGGDETDLWTSPTDPIFWLHHAMVDRVWWIWQALHSDQAVSIMGTIRILDPTAKNATLDDLINLGVNGGPKVLRDFMNTLGGTPLCYKYV